MGSDAAGSAPVPRCAFQLLTRSARGVQLTPAGRAFLDHARLALAQVEAAGEAARRIAKPAKPSFALGFLTGQEMDWLPKAMNVLRDELPRIEVTVASQVSPQLAEALSRGKLDLAFMRAEPQMRDLEYRPVVKEPLVVVLPSDHRLALRQTSRSRTSRAKPSLGFRIPRPRCAR